MCNCKENKIRRLQREFARELEVDSQSDFLMEINSPKLYIQEKPKMILCK